MFFLTPLTFLFLFFFFSTVLRYLPSFPTRRSSDLTRASAVAARLMDRYYVAVAGIALISPVLDFGTLRFTAGKDRKSVVEGKSGERGVRSSIRKEGRCTVDRHERVEQQC